MTEYDWWHKIPHHMPINYASLESWCVFLWAGSFPSKVDHKVNLRLFFFTWYQKKKKNLRSTMTLTRSKLTLYLLRQYTKALIKLFYKYNSLSCLYGLIAWGNIYVHTQIIKTYNYHSNFDKDYITSKKKKD